MNINSESLFSDKIKIFMVRKIIRNKSYKVKEIINKDIFGNKDFDAFIDLITNLNTIENFRDYFRFLNLYLKFNNIRQNNVINNKFVKNILCAYTIIYYPEIMNIDNKNEVSKQLIQKANALILNIKVINLIKVNGKFSFSLLKSINKLFDKCEDFIKIFTEWKNLDMEAIICNLAKIYMDMERDFKEIEQNTKKDESGVKLLEMTKENLEKEKEKIILKVKKMNSKNGIEIFNKYYIFLNQQLDLNIYQEKLGNAISENIQKAYWDIIKTDMLKVPPDYEKVINLLEEAKSLLKQCIPHREDLLSEIDMNLEIETLKHYMDNGVDVNECISSMIAFIISKVREYQARSEEVSFNKFLVDFEKLRSQETCRLSEMLIFFFQGVMPRLDLIVQGKKNFEEWYRNNVNK